MSLVDFVPGLKEVVKKEAEKELPDKPSKICLWYYDEGSRQWVKTDKCFSRSVVTSWLQKSIRRGNWQQAAIAAWILVQNEPWYFWHRIRIIAVEDCTGSPEMLGIVYGLQREFETRTGYKISKDELRRLGRIVDIVCAASDDRELCDKLHEYVNSLTGYSSPMLNWEGLGIAVYAAILLARARKGRIGFGFAEAVNEYLNRKKAGRTDEELDRWFEELFRVPDVVYDVHVKGKAGVSWFESSKVFGDVDEEYARFRKEVWEKVFKDD